MLTRRIQLLALQVFIVVCGFAVGFQWWSAPAVVAIAVVIICLPSGGRKV